MFSCDNEKSPAENDGTFFLKTDRERIETEIWFRNLILIFQLSGLPMTAWWYLP
jgi:hypothetical protein